MTSKENLVIAKCNEKLNENVADPDIYQHQNFLVGCTKNFKEALESNASRNPETEISEEKSVINNIPSKTYLEVKDTSIMNQYSELLVKQSISNEFTEKCDFEEKVDSFLNFKKDISEQKYNPGDRVSKVRSDHNSLSEGTNVGDCFSNQTVTSNTPSKDSTAYIFKKGVTYTSTPFHQFIRIKKISEFENLSVIKEELGSVDDTTNELQVTVTETVGLLNNSNDSNLLINDGRKCLESADQSILRKDELSLLIDFPNEKNLKEGKVGPSKQNLTLSVKNLETVVYKNIIDKTVDELLIGGGDLVSIKDLNIFETENDRKLLLDKATRLKKFFSPNDDENRDNNDPEWELLQKLDTDDDRYKEVRKIWRNLAIPDLKQNLSKFNWRKKNSLPVMKNIVPIKTNHLGKRKRRCNYDCSEVFDVGIKNLHAFYGRQSKGLELDCENYTSPFKKPRFKTGYTQMAKRNHKFDEEKLAMCVQERLKRHEEAKQEIKAVHQFYNGLKNQGNGGYGNMMLISHAERQDILDIENMISHYASWYPEQSNF